VPQTNKKYKKNPTCFLSNTLLGQYRVSSLTPGEGKTKLTADPMMGGLYFIVGRWQSR
jgi:hypothetical protein